MLKRRPPVEIAGYVTRYMWTVDHRDGTAEFRPVSWVNDDFDENDFLPWTEDSADDSCPF
jgi:hypothetical protein